MPFLCLKKTNSDGRTRTDMKLPPRDFRHTTAFAATLMFVRWTLSLPYSSLNLGRSRQVSAPSLLFIRLGSGFPSALPVKASLNLTPSTQRFPICALNYISPLRIPFRHIAVILKSILCFHHSSPVHKI